MKEKKKVLVVEDSETLAKAIKILLEAKGMSVEYTCKGNSVVDLVKKEKFELIILDLMMPNVSGADVFLMLKNDAGTKDVPVIILTARVDAIKMDPALEKCDKFMTKPFDNKNLVEEVLKLLKK